jgi:hypothetical protein
MSDYFTLRKDYYLIAENEDHAIEKANHVTPPSYIEETGENFDNTEVQEEVAILVLRRVAPQPGQPQRVCLIPAYKDEGADAYCGYEISEDSRVSSVEVAYPKSEWRLEE